MLKNKANVDLADNEGTTPLHKTAEKGYHKIAEKLLQYKANFNLKNKEGQTPLVVAKFNGNQKVVDVLIKYGAKPWANERVH